MLLVSLVHINGLETTPRRMHEAMDFTQRPMVNRWWPYMAYRG